MKKVIRVLAIALGICVLGGAFVRWGVRSYIAKVREVQGEFRSRHDVAECSAVFRKPDAQIRGMSRLRLELSGVPEEKQEVAFNAVVDAACSCVMRTKGDVGFATFAVNPKNKSRIASCINEGFASVDTKYGADASR